MKHPCERDWSRFIDDDLPPLRRKALAGHLERCPACQRVVAAYQRMGHLARTLKGPTWSGPAARDSWRQNALRPGAAISTRRPYWAVGLAGAALLIGFVGAARWDYRVGLARQTDRLVSEHNASRLGDLSLILGENRP